jgi:lysophospholipase L1-like esterase
MGNSELHEHPMHLKRIRSSLACACALILFATGCTTNIAPKSTSAPVPTFESNTTAAAKTKTTPAPDLATNPPPQTHLLHPDLPSIFVAGDSTAARGAGEQQQGWAVPFTNYFDPEKVNVVNGARGGRSSRTFVTEGLWSNLVSKVKRGDIVLIQFGHNDGGPVDALRSRGSLPGIGEETKEIENSQTQKHETVHTFGWYLRKMVADTKAKGATPVILGLTVRDIWNDGHIERGSGHFNQWANQVARSEHIQYLNLTDDMADKFETMGEDKVKTLYPRDHTHFNAEGADLHAAMVVANLKGMRPNPVQKFLSEKGESVEPERFAWLNLPRPAKWNVPSLFLIGDSTVRNGRGDGAGGQWGWGDYLGTNFDSQKINIVNRAVGGTSSRSFLAAGYWDRVIGMLKKGDFVMMQFGHNDNGSPTNPPPGRASLKGVGDETAEAVDPATGKTEVAHTFGWYLRKYVQDARAKGATPIICSLIPRKMWKDGKVVRNKDTFAGWAEQVAHDEKVPFVDLNEIIAAKYDALGAENVEPLFADPHTHTSEAGAELNAQSVIEGLKALPDDPLAPYLVDRK